MLLFGKERFSSYTGDVELHRSAEEIRPFFAELDKRPACRGNKEQILSGVVSDGKQTVLIVHYNANTLRRFLIVPKRISQ